MSIHGDSERSLELCRSVHKAIVGAVGEPKAYAQVLIAQDGTLTWGGNFSQDAPIQRTIQRYLKQMSHDVAATIKYFEKREADHD